jgi:uncharacterized protein (DUF362 family)
MSAPGQNPEMDRRDFLKRTAKAGAAIAVAAGVGLSLHDRKGPAAGSVSQTLSLPDFSLPALGRKLSIVTGTDRLKTVNRALQALGGIGQFIKPGDRVVLKVNAAFASPPALSATTNPDLTAEIARLCFRAGATSIIVTDNPINDPNSCFALSGIATAIEAAGAKLALPNPGSFHPTTLSGGRLIRDWPLLFEPFQRATKLIGIAPVKDHHRSGASLAMKNWYGLLGGRRNIFHQDIYTIILELARLVRPTLVVLDGTTSMMTNGPTGGSLDDLKATNTMIVSTDQVAADAFGATLLGKTAADLPFIGKAAAAGVGTADYESLNPARDHVA